ncbi:unnamed protein product [Diamesa serratosioi]
MLLEITGLNVFRDSFYRRIGDKVRITVFNVMPFFAIFVSIRCVVKFWDDTEEAITAMIAAMTLIQLVAKMLNLIVHKKTHRELVKVVASDSESSKDDPIQHDTAVKFYNHAKSMSAFIAIVYWNAHIIFMIYPFITTKEWMLPLNFELPYTNHKEPLGYRINYLYCIYQTVQAEFLILGYDSLFFTHCIYISSKYKMLENLLNNIGDYEHDYNTEEKQYELIKQCSKQHTELLE